MKTKLFAQCPLAMRSQLLFQLINIFTDFNNTFTKEAKKHYG